jgi:16S rRNA G966 N2-methylase RsmD
MKIITGIHKTRNIIMPKGIRPTQNRVRKAVFDILGDVKGLSFLELFAGSGAVGLEALSRGASGVIFVEGNRDAQVAISSNIQALKLENCMLMSRGAEETIPFLHKSGRKFDIIFMDPPYHKLNSLSPSATPRADGNCAGVPLSAAKKTLQILGAYDILSPNGFVIVQHFKSDKLADESAGLRLVKKAKYGDTLLSFYQRAS